MVSFLDQHALFASYCKETKKFGMLFSFSLDLDNCDDIVKAAPFLDFKVHTQIFSDEIGFVFADTEEEILALFNKTVGDEGPTKSNPYEGPGKVYALTCGSDGEFISCNS